jgi:hypothetical protein
MQGAQGGDETDSVVFVTPFLSEIVYVGWGFNDLHFVFDFVTLSVVEATYGLR